MRVYIKNKDWNEQIQIARLRMKIACRNERKVTRKEKGQ